jgi:uncharacterized damage-inducible protein DinB
MIRTEVDRLAPSRGFRTAEAALHVAALEELTGRLRAALRGIGPWELAWQPRRGVNTIGMLLAHIAIVEVWWSVGVLEGRDRETPFRRLLGLDEDGDGMPLPPRGTPPAALAGRRLADLMRIVGRGRAEVRRVAAGLTARDLVRTRRRMRRDGLRQVFDARWVLHHLVEHLAGHFGQILLLRHLYRDARRRGRPTRARRRP